MQNVRLQQVEHHPHENMQHECCAGTHDANVSPIVLPRIRDHYDIFLHAQSGGIFSILRIAFVV
jgi:hypothetical protein